MPPGKNLLEFSLIFLTALVLGGCSAAVLSSRTPTALDFATTTPSLTATMPATATVTAHLIPSDTITDTPSPTATRVPTTAVATPLARENIPLPLRDQPIGLANASQVVELARWGKGNANGIAYSPDGSILAVASSLGIYFYDNNQKLVETIETNQLVDSLAFVPNSDLLAAGTQDGMIDFWQWQSKTLQKTIDSGSNNKIIGLYFSGSGDRIASVQEDASQSLNVWQISTGESLFQQNFAYTNNVAFANDFLTILIPGPYAIDQYDVLNGAYPGVQFQLPQSAQYLNVFQVALSADGKRMAVVAGSDSDIDTVFLWNLPALEPDSSFRIASKGNPHRFAPEDCAGAYDPGIYSGVAALAFTPDGQSLLVGLDDGSVQVRRSRDGALQSELKNSMGSQPYALQFAFQMAAKSVAILYSNDVINVHNWQSANRLGQISGHVQEYSALAITADGHSILAGASDDLVRFWNPASNRQTRQMKIQADSMAISPDGRSLALGSADGSLRLLDLASGRVLGRRQDFMDAPDGLAFSADGRKLYAISRDCTLRVYRAAPGLPPVAKAGLYLTKSRIIFPEYADLAFSPDGKWLGIAGPTPADIGIMLMDPQNISQASLSEGEDKPYFDGVAFSPDSKAAAFAGDGKLAILNLADLSMSYYSFDAKGERLAYSPGGDLLVVGAGDGGIWLVNTKTMSVLAKLAGHHETITALAFSKDGRFFVSASADGTVRVWGVPK